MFAERQNEFRNRPAALWLVACLTLALVACDAPAVRAGSARPDDPMRMADGVIVPIASRRSAADTALFTCGELLAQPTATSIAVNACLDRDADVYVEYGTAPDAFSKQTTTVRSTGGRPVTLTLTGLAPDTRHYYRFRCRLVGGSIWQERPVRSFHTARASGQPFTFAIEADPHMDAATSGVLFSRTLANISTARPDFMIDLGDTFMGEKLSPLTKTTLEARYQLMRGFFDTTCHSVPLLLVQGNHDGELGWLVNGTSDNLAVWATNYRKEYFPNPEPDGFYTGDTASLPHVGRRQGWYAWTWGDAHFIVLDVYWNTVTKPGASKNIWDFTLGRTQYEWFTRTLAQSTAKYVFVFAHQILGGIDTEGRGGIEGVPYYEMGGRSSDSTYTFEQYRPGWAKPIHQLMVEHRVTAFFHGHDHVFVRQDLDGIVYQELPQPGYYNTTNPERSYNSISQATAYGYVNGTVMSSSGYLRVTVSDTAASVAYVRSYLSEHENAQRRNGEVAHAYSVRPRDVVQPAGIPVRRLPDTGQQGKYTTTRGEDADYAINTPSFTMHGDGTVTDNVTGLMWQRTDGGEMTIEAAARMCDTLSLGGYVDWRLPSCHELFNILNHDRLNPSLDTAYFARNTAAYWWSSDRLLNDSTRVWVANAGGGVGPHPKGETVSAGGTKRFHVRAVRDARAPQTVDVRFRDNNDGTVSDLSTGLMWMKEPAGTMMPWEQALAYSEGLSSAGHDDWRLPNIKELSSINDERLVRPSVDTSVFTGVTSGKYWSSTTQYPGPDRAWHVDFQNGLVTYEPKTTSFHVLCVRGGTTSTADTLDEALIPAGQFEMGDHHGFVDPSHPSDELPVHVVRLDSFHMAKTETTNAQYLAFLNDAHTAGALEVRDGIVYARGGSEAWCYTREHAAYSSIAFDGSRFSIADFRAAHPMVGVMWTGAAAYCNWISAQRGLTPCYDLATGACDVTRSGYRLPTEAEWEYAGRGGLLVPYRIYPTGDTIDVRGVNLPGSGDPYETGEYPWTTPAGFYNGALRLKSAFNWPAPQASYQTVNTANGYGLYDMQGNVWEFVNDWYGQDYYRNSPVANPTGPAAGFIMPDGKPYRGMRSGNWYNGLVTAGVNDGHSRVANRNPSYYRGPQDPNHPWYHVGFRVARSTGGSTSDVEQTANPSPDAPQLAQNHPNPFRPTTTVTFSLPQSTAARLVVYNVLGQEIAILADGMHAAGTHHIRFDAGELPAGLYLCRLVTDKATLTRRMLLAQ